MKIQELINTVNNNNNKMLNNDQLQRLVAKTIEAKSYISIKEKRVLIDNIIDSCILYEDGIYKFDDIDKYVAFTMKTIAAYTNIELSEDIEEDYDALCEARLLNTVIEIFNGEYENVNLLLQMKCEYILSENNIEAQVGKFLAGVSDKIDNFVDVLSNKLGDLNLDNLPISVEDIGKLMEFINSVKK